MHWTWQDYTDLPLPVYDELTEQLASEAAARRDL
jgi:hypothetical protein